MGGKKDKKNKHLGAGVLAGTRTRLALVIQFTNTIDSNIDRMKFIRRRNGRKGRRGGRGENMI